MQIKIRRKIILVAAVILSLSTIIGIYAGTNPPGPGTANSPGNYNDPNGTLRQIQTLPFQPYNGTDNPQTHTFTFDVLGIEQSQPPGGVIFTVTTTGSITAKFIGSQPTVICTLCSKSYSGVTETVTYSGGVTDTLTVIWPKARIINEPGSPATLFKDTFLYSNNFLTNQWTIDRYGLTDPTPQTSGGFEWFASSSGTAVQTSHVTTYAGGATSSFNPNTVNYLTNTVVKRKLTIGLIPFSAKTTTSTSQLHIGLSSLLSVGNFPGSGPFGTPTVGFGNDSCNFSSTLQDNIGNEYFFVTNTGYIEGDICGDPSGSKSTYPLYTGDPTLFTVLTLETRGSFCTTGCTDNSASGSNWVFFRVYQENKNGQIISASDNSLNVTSPQNGVLAPLANPSYIFISQHNNGVSGIVTKIALVDLQNYGSPVVLPPPPSNIPFPTCISCNIQGLILQLAGYIGFGNPQLGAFVLWGAIMGVTLMFVAVYTRASVPTSIIGMCLTLLFIFGGFLPTVLAFFMLFGTGVLMAVVFYRIITGTAGQVGRQI